MNLYSAFSSLHDNNDIADEGIFDKLHSKSGDFLNNSIRYRRKEAENVF